MQLWAAYRQARRRPASLQGSLVHDSPCSHSRATASEDNAALGQLPGKPAGARPDYRGRWCAVSRGHPDRPNPPSHRATLGQLCAVPWKLPSSIGKGIAWIRTRDLQAIERILHSRGAPLLGCATQSPTMEISGVVGDLITPEMLEEECGRVVGNSLTPGDSILFETPLRRTDLLRPGDGVVVRGLDTEDSNQHHGLYHNRRIIGDCCPLPAAIRMCQIVSPGLPCYKEKQLMKGQEKEKEMMEKEKKRKEKVEKKKLLLAKQEKQKGGVSAEYKCVFSADKKKRGREDDYMISDVMTKERKVDEQSVPYQQPKNFTGGVLRLYQIEGMEWLRMLWENGINRILADEIGLGMTVQCIATISMMVKNGVTGPFLVVGPLSTLPNWVSEFKRFTPEIPVLLYYGPLQERHNMIKLIRKRQGSLRVNPVVITSFEIAMRDRRSLQNNLAELWSLLNFLLPDVFDDLKSFESWFDITSVTTGAENFISKEREQNILHMLHQDTKPVVMTDSGRPERRSKGPVNYNKLAGESTLALERYLAKLQKEADKQPSRPLVDVQVSVDAEINLKLQNVLMLLKRCCNHPYLIEYPLDPAMQNFKIDEQLVQSSGKFLILDRMLPELQKRGLKNPQADLQAQDMSQNRPDQTVVVYRLVTANTIDQKTVERAAAKRKLEKMVIHKSQMKNMKKEQDRLFKVIENTNESADFHLA
ncbi:UNVERIFIED_CONTAM: hypothetical protein FKN15_013742 [Acipenser sinensis]